MYSVHLTNLFGLFLAPREVKFDYTVAFWQNQDIYYSCVAETPQSWVGNRERGMGPL